MDIVNLMAPAEEMTDPMVRDGPRGTMAASPVPPRVHPVRFAPPRRPSSQR